MLLRISMIYSFLNSTEMMTILIFGLILFGHVASAAEPPHPHGSEGTTHAPTISVHACRSAMSGELAQKGKPTPDNSMSDSPGFEGIQIETADITLYELFFETILQAQMVQTMEHPQIDRLRGLVGMAEARPVLQQLSLLPGRQIRKALGTCRAVEGEEAIAINAGESSECFA